MAARKRFQANGSPSVSVFRVSRFSILMLVAIALGVVALAPGIKTLVEQRQQIQDLQAQVRSQEQKLQGMQGQSARWQDPAYIRAQSRERLFFLYPGETSYIVIDDIKRSPQPTFARVNPPSTSLQVTKYVWTDVFLQSIIEAGTTQDPKAGSSQ